MNSLTIDRCIKKLPPHLAYILWNCSGVDVSNLEAILVKTWHRQGAFQIPSPVIIVIIVVVVIIIIIIIIQ